MSNQPNPGAESGGDAFRKVLHQAYTAVRSFENSKSISTLTLDHMIQAQINRLKKGVTTSIVDAQGASIGDRPSRWDQLDTLENDINSMVDALEKAGDDRAKLSALGIDEKDTTT